MQEQQDIDIEMHEEEEEVPQIYQAQGFLKKQISDTSDGMVNVLDQDQDINGVPGASQ